MTITITPQGIESLARVLATEVQGPTEEMHRFLSEQFSVLNNHSGAQTLEQLMRISSILVDSLEDEEEDCLCGCTADQESFYNMEDEVSLLSEQIRKETEVQSVAKLIHEQVAEQDAFLMEEAIAIEVEAMIEAVLKEIAYAIVEEGYVDEVFTIGENSTELYTFFFEMRFAEELEEMGYTAEYKNEYTVYLMAEIARILTEEYDYSLHFLIEEDVVFPALMPKKA